MEKEKLSELVADIKKKKELRELNDDFVLQYLKDYFKDKKKFSFNKRSKQYKTAIKEIRGKLRRVYGLFRAEEDLKRREELIDQLLSGNKKLIPEILKTHSSTRERLDFYPELYTGIFAITGKPQSIIDLGCGINPFSFPFMKLKKVEYFAYDLSEDEIEYLNRFFRFLKIKGKAEILDMFNFSHLPKADVCFLFKMTDVLDKGKGHKITEKVINLIPSKYVVVSFPTHTMSGKRMNFPRRRWIELMCKRLGYEYHYLDFDNEVFYVVEKRL
tara:strand:+ start:503 stop:1318 length:816 start_codon:yes stop_codon:yes gene_type:complete